MPHFIEHIIEPEELLVSWRPRNSIDRMRRFVAKVTRQDETASFKYLYDEPDFAVAKKKGFRGYPGLRLKHRIHENALPLLMRRLPPRKRTDIEQYVQGFGIEHEGQISDFGLLGYSGARLPGDDFTFVHPFTDAKPPVEFWMEVSGYRYHRKGIPYHELSVGDAVTFAAEPNNERDPKAIALVHGGTRMGYVSRGLTAQFHRWLDQGCSLTAIIERKNGSAERPLIFLYVEVRG